MASNSTGDDGESEGRGTAALVIGLTLLAVPLVGCAEDGGQTDGPGGDGEALTAEAALPDARPVAEEWSEDAVLIGAGILETTEEAPSEWPSEAPDYQPDENVGDGLVPQWAFTFKDGEDRIVVYVSADGETHQGPDPQEDAFMEAEIADWEYDSAEAIEAAKEENDNFTAVLEADDVRVGYILVGGEEGDEGWILDAQSESQGEQVTLTVDANSGEVREFGTGS